MIKQLNKSTVETVGRPVRILQFGEGNFLRAFVDWQIDIANEKGVMDAGVAVCQPIIDPERKVLGMIDLMHRQDNMYHVYLEGIENKRPKKDVRLVKSIMDSFNPYVDYAKYEAYFLSPELKITISNTTEAGIRYEEGDDLTACPPKSYPAKMTALLYKRFKHFNGDPTKGLCIICCELIENNGSTLHEYVIRHAEYHKLGQDFIDWVENSCHFCDTLVDRIVPGFPREQIGEIREEIGYDDNLVVKAELYHLWAIGGPGYKEVMKELPLDKAGLHVIFMPSIKQFRDKKVRILNGSHTGMVPIALQMGCETVMDAFNTPDIERFVNDMVAEEVRRRDSGAFLQPLHQAHAPVHFAQLAFEMGGAQLSDRARQLVQGAAAGRTRSIHVRRADDPLRAEQRFRTRRHEGVRGLHPRQLGFGRHGGYDHEDREEERHLHRRFLGGSGLHRDRCGLCPRHRDAGHERCLEEVFRSVTSQLFRCGVSDGSWHGLRSCSQVRPIPEPPPRRGLCGTRTCGLFY